MTSSKSMASLFTTPLYRAALSDHGVIDPSELERSCYGIAQDDEAGQDWCEANDFPGYTSYASLTDLPWRFPIFADVVKAPRGAAPVCLCQTRCRRCAAVGKLAAPRGPDEQRRRRPCIGIVQL